MKTETTTWSEYLKGGKDTAEKIFESEEKINPKDQDCESHNQGSK